MDSSLLSTKLYVPPARAGLVARPQLLERLGVCLNYALILVSAPAGFGKTTLLSEWVRHSQPPLSTAWFSIEESENDPARFWEYFIAALRAVQPEIGETSLNLLRSPQPLPAQAVLTPLINEIAGIPKDFFLVLDDYHFIQSETVHAGLTFLLEHQPPRLHLVMAKPEGYIRLFADFGMTLAPLLRRAIAAGIEPEYAHKLLNIIEAEERQRKIRKGAIPATASGLLSEREMEVLRLMAAGLTNQQIAGKLVISLNTAKSHVYHIFAKLNAKDRLQAVTRARELELI